MIQRRLSNHVEDMVRRYEAGRLERQELDRRKYAMARKSRRESMQSALAQILRSVCRFQLRALIEGFEDLRDAKHAPLPRRVSKYVPGVEELRNRSGLEGERRVEKRLRRLCKNPCTALYGYNGAKGEIDIILVGRYGITAIEVKNYAGTIFSDGESWWRVHADESKPLCDRTNRSPGVQLKQCADELQSVLASSGFWIPVQRMVVLAHPHVRFGSPFSPHFVQVWPIGLLTRDCLFSRAEGPMLSRDRIAQICDAISRAHEARASNLEEARTANRTSPLYECSYQNVVRSISNPLRPWMFVVGTLLILTLGPLASLIRSHRRLAASQVSIQRPVLHRRPHVYRSASIAFPVEKKQSHKVFPHRAHSTSIGYNSNNHDSSSKLLARISSVIAHEQAFQGMRIIPVVSNDRVTLSGTVSSYAAKVLASSEIGKIDGVRIVLNNLRVDASNAS